MKNADACRWRELADRTRPRRPRRWLIDIANEPASNYDVDMIGRRKKTFFELHRLLRAIEAAKDDLALVRQLNGLLIREILRSEANIGRHKAAMKELRAQLKTARPSREDANKIRRTIARTERYIDTYFQQRYIWKCFGDGLAYAYLDKYAVKHAFFETETYDVKPSAGMLGGKSGLAGEIACLLSALEHEVPAVLCDITNTLRYGDVCLLGASDPCPIEVKSRAGLNQRGKRQAAALKRLMDFLETDQADNFRAIGTTRRVEVNSQERNYRDAMNACIAKASREGFASAQPEPGLAYFAIYGRFPDDAFEILRDGGPWVYTMLNEDKTAGTWAPYEPFTLSIRDANHLLDFIEGRLSLIVAFDSEALAARMARPGWDVRFDGDATAAMQFHHQETGALIGVSRQFLSRIGFEFVAPSWIAESQAPQVEELNMAMSSMAEGLVQMPMLEHDALPKAMFGKGAEIWPEVPPALDVGSGEVDAAVLDAQHADQNRSA